MAPAWRTLLAALLAVLALVVPAGAAIPDFLGRSVPTLAPLLREITPAVVNIAVRGRYREENPLFRDPFFRQFFDLPRHLEREMRSTGSGVIVDAQRGYVLTNHHVIENATVVEITTKDNRRLRARLIGSDPETDIAVLQVQGGAELKALAFGDSDKLQVGDFVLAIGNPFGLGQTVTSGIVSALGRNNLGIEGYEDFIQTDASINPGNSGGALVDLRGQLIGINTAILSPGSGNIGIGFAIPANIARRAMNDIIAHGAVQRGRIGIATQELTPELATAVGTDRRDGAVVAAVEAGSPAARAGLRPMDIIVAVNGDPVSSPVALRNKFSFMPPNTQVTLEFERAGTQRSVSLRVAPGRYKNADAL